jgi:ATP-dependent Lon protease
MIAPLFLSNEQNIKAVEYAIEHNKLVVVTVSKHGKEGKREVDSFYDVGVVGNIMRKVSLPDGKIKVLFQGLVKGHINEFTKENDLFANVDILKTEEANEENIKSVIEVLIDNVKKLSRLNIKFPADLVKTIEENDDATRIADLISSVLKLRKSGLRLGELIRGEFVPNHELAMSTLHSYQIPSIQLDLKTSLQYLRRETIDANVDQKGWAIVKYNEISLGWIKQVQGKAKNHYPLNWRILMRG